MSVAEKLTEIAENVPKVFEAGVAQGYENGYAEGHEEGVRSTGFWAKYQQKGRRKNYDRAFANPDEYDAGWYIKDFKPEYNMRPDSAFYMFRGIHGERGEVDLVEVLKEQGVTLDFGNCKDLCRAFGNTNVIRHVGEIDAHSADDVRYLFYENSGIQTVDKLIVKKSHIFTGAFSHCFSLEHIIFEGEIGNTIQFHRYTTGLDLESIVSIVDALCADVTGKSVYFGTDNIKRVFGSVDSPTWLALVDSKPNWSFVLA